MKKPDVSFFFPVYNDEKTVRLVALKAMKLLDEKANSYEIIIVNDASPDKSGEVADELAQEYECVHVIHHKVNKGYGAAVKAGIEYANYEWVCMVDGDDEYDIEDLGKMLDLRHYYLLMIGFRYKKMYSAKRVFISYIYNFVLQFLFKVKFRDISTGIRCFNKCIFKDIEIHSNSPFFGAELAIKSMLRGYPVGEIGIQTFPREFGQGSATSATNIIRTIKDMFKMRREVFSEQYHLPEDRKRG